MVVTSLKRLDEWFSIDGFLSKTGLLILSIGIFLTAISYVKGVQVLMFVPAFVLALFIYSLYDVWRAHDYFDATWKKIEGQIHLQILWKTKHPYAFLRLVSFNGQRLKVLVPNKSFEFSNVDLNDEFRLIFQGRLDIFRRTIRLPKAPKRDLLDKANQARQFGSDLYFNSRPLNEEDDVKRIDYLQTAKRDKLYIKEVISDESLKSTSTTKASSPLKLLSNQALSFRKHIDKGPLVEWAMILLGILGAHLEWGNVVFTFFALIIVFVYWFWKRVLNHPPYGRGEMNFVALLIFFICLLEATKSPNVVEAGVHCFILISIFKHFFIPQRRDTLTYIFITLFVFVALSLFTLKLWFGILFFIFLLFAIALFSIYAGGEREKEYQADFGSAFTLSSYTHMNAAILVMTVALFFILPHGSLEKDTSAQLGRTSEAKVGFSEEVSLKEIGSIKEDFAKQIVIENAEAQKVRQYQQLYWRGRGFHDYIDDRWKTRNRDYKPFRSYSTVHATEKWTIRYYLDNQKNIFLPKIPVKLTGPPIEQLLYDRSIARFTQPQPSATTIEAVFLKIPNGDAIIDYPFDRHDIDYQLTGRVKTMFRNFWSRVPDKVTKNPYLLSEYIKNKAGFKYSIKRPASDLESFLYKQKRGHCEYFATVLALSLQNFGYQARFVNGFHGGEFNEPASAWIVRNIHAHSWVEVLRKDGRWEILDPTPAGDGFDFWFQTNPFLKKMILYYDVFELKWYRTIVSYTGQKQRELWHYFVGHIEYGVILLVLVGVAALMKKVWSQTIYPHYQRSLKEKFLWWLKAKAGSDSFVLKGLSRDHPQLTKLTRQALYRMKTDASLLRELKKEWKRVLT